MSRRDELNRYENSLATLNTASGQLSTLLGSVTDLKKTLTNDFNIDDKGLEEERLTTIIGQLSSGSSTISRYTNALNSKIQSLREEIDREEEEERRRQEEEEKQKLKSLNKTNKTVT